MASIGKTTEAEEDLYVFVEFDDTMNIEKYGNVHVLGIETKNPIIQLDDTFFSGYYDNPLGTYMFFEDDPLATSTDSLFEKLPERNLKYYLKTRKCIKADHVYVKQNDGAEKENRVGHTTDEENNVTPVSFATVTEAVDKFKKDWKISYPDIFSDSEQNNTIRQCILK